MLPRQLNQHLVQARVRQLPPHHTASLRRFSRPRPVERQRQLVGQPGQRLPPVLDLRGQHAAVGRVPAEQVPLPQA